MLGYSSSLNRVWLPQAAPPVEGGVLEAGRLDADAAGDMVADGFRPPALPVVELPARRQRRRASLLVIRAKPEAVTAGISTTETEFLASIVLPDNTTSESGCSPGSTNPAAPARSLPCCPRQATMPADQPVRSRRRLPDR